MRIPLLAFTLLAIVTTAIVVGVYQGFKDEQPNHFASNAESSSSNNSTNTDTSSSVADSPVTIANETSTNVTKIINVTLSLSPSNPLTMFSPSFLPSTSPTQAPSTRITVTQSPVLSPSTRPVLEEDTPWLSRDSMPSFMPIVNSSRISSNTPSRSTLKPSLASTVATTGSPVVSPTIIPSNAPTTSSPTNATTTGIPTTAPSNIAVDVSFDPGQLTIEENGLLLSTGLTSRIIATSGSPIIYANGYSSSISFHSQPDAGQTFLDWRIGNNDGGWIYVSNSEVRPDVGMNLGGVGAITFNAQGDVIDYQMILENTTANCGGGRTPWGAWISCEEYARGVIYQTDPTGNRSSVQITLGSQYPSLFESFAYDVRDYDDAHFFVSVDSIDGSIQRFTPREPDWENPWTVLTGFGTTDFLLLHPTDFNSDGYSIAGTYNWTNDKELGDANAERYYSNVEGIDADGGDLYFVSKRFKMLYVLDLDSDTYIATSTKFGAFDGQPDQIQRLLASSEHGSASDEFLFFTEDGGSYAGVHARLADGTFVAILESSQYTDETTGLAFSPDGKRMYIAYQDNGLLFEITRQDGLPFYATSLNVKYHSLTSAS
jgi:uncharacterized protein